MNFYLVLALVGTILFTIKLVMALTGSDLGIEMADGDELEHGDSTSHFELLSYQSILAFVMTFGWSGLAFSREFGLGNEVSFILAFLSGVSGAFISAGSMYLLQKLNHVPKYEKPKVGDIGRAATAIPANREGLGLMSINNNGRVEELPVLSDEQIPMHSLVSIVDNETQIVVKLFNQ